MDERTAAQVVRESVNLAYARMVEAEAELGRLDAAAGDGDHGAGMARGLRNAHEALGFSPQNANAGELLIEAGAAFADAAGGASGALFGALMSTVGENLGNDPCSASELAAALTSGLEMVCALGKAQPGDKTIVDTLDPFVRAFCVATGEGISTAEAWKRALPAAEAGALATANMIATRGRSARLGERSRGHLDPGAMSMLYLLQAVAEGLDNG